MTRRASVSATHIVNGSHFETPRRINGTRLAGVCARGRCSDQPRGFVASVRVCWRVDCEGESRNAIRSNLHSVSPYSLMQVYMQAAPPFLGEERRELYRRSSNSPPISLFARSSVHQTDALALETTAAVRLIERRALSGSRWGHTRIRESRCDASPALRGAAPRDGEDKLREPQISAHPRVQALH